MPGPISSPHLVVHKKVWHYRLFRWSLGIVDAWRGSRGQYEERFEYGTSLFHYLRVIIIYAPSAILSNLALAVWIVISLFVLPVQVGGVWQYLGFWLLLFVLGIFLILLYAVIFRWAGSDLPFWYRAQRFFSRKTPKKYEPAPAKRYAPGLIDVVKRYIRSRRDRLRPLITFVEKPE